jgi:hypothetical protein
LVVPKFKVFLPGARTAQPGCWSGRAIGGPLPGNLANTGGIMKVEAQTSEREVLARLVERVTYQNADNGFCVVRVKTRGHRDLVTLVGHAATIPKGGLNGDVDAAGAVPG